jgi:hypothetical protein
MIEVACCSEHQPHRGFQRRRLRHRCDPPRAGTQRPARRTGRSIEGAAREVDLLRHLRGQLPRYRHNLGQPSRRDGAHKESESSLAVSEPLILNGGRRYPVPNRLAS